MHENSNTKRASPLSIYLIGATGKMGTKVLELIRENPSFRMSKASPAADVIIDFSLAVATLENLKLALKAGKPLVIGSTGQTPSMKEAITAASQEIPILFSPNFSLGMALCMQTVPLLAKHADKISIIETHHSHKKDAPSGTALALTSAMQKPAPITSIREGEVLGTHKILFEYEGEQIELTHNVLSRATFARGALKAAEFLHSRPPGLYSFQDLFTE